MYQIKLNYFTNLFVIKRFKYRQFIGFNYLNGIKRFDYELINLDDPNGIRGFSQADLFGIEKIVLNLETVVFTPYYLLGFRFVGFGFFDLGKIGSGSQKILKESLYSGLGFGIRFQNERLVFPTFELRLAYYPNLSRIPLEEMIRFLGEKKLNPPNFYFKNPKLLDYR
jgi:hemolysin activation/secretion protein